jgi:hypothetical protein
MKNETVKLKEVELNEVPVQAEWDLGKDYVAVGHYQSQIAEDVAEYNRLCREFIKNHKINKKYKEHLISMFPKAEIKLEANKKGIVYRIKFNASKGEVLDTLASNKLLKTFEPGKYNTRFDLNEKI